MTTRPAVHSLRHLLGALLLPLLAASSATAALAQAKKVLSVEDYSRWRTINGAQISGDGRWVAYGLSFTNVVTPDAKPELRIKRLDTGVEVVVKDASQPQFSPDSRWILYQVEPPAPSRAPARGTAGAAAVPGAPAALADSTADTTAAGRARAAMPELKRVELRELATGIVRKWDDIGVANFSPTASHLLLSRRPAVGAAASGPSGGAPPGPPGGQLGRGAGGATVRGTDALLVNLATGRSQFLGSVGEFAFNRSGDLLAYLVNAVPTDGNGLFVIDLATGATMPLDNDARSYAAISWNDAGTGIAAMKGKEVPKMREKENVLLVIPAVRAPARITLDSAAAGIPRGFMLSERAPISWSDDNARVFFGLIPQTAAPDTGRKKSTDSVADVDVWRTQDDRIQSEQMIRANVDRNRTFRQALDLRTGKFVALSDSTLRDIEVSPDGRWAVGEDERPYVTDSGRTRADVYRVDASTGARTLIAKAQLVNEYAPGFSADSKHWLFWNDAKYNDYDLDANVTRTLAPSGAPSFTDMEWDYPGTRPPYGVEGFSKDGRGVIVQARYDLWYLPYGGSAPARNLTNGEGAKSETEFRWIRTTPADPMAPRVEREGRVIDLAKPVTLSSYGFWTKRAGFHSLVGAVLKPLVYEDAAFNTPVRAARADRFLFTRQTFAEFPDLRVSGPTFADAQLVSNANPQQAEYAWGRRILFDFTLRDGTRSQGILALPDDYRAGEKRPMLVTFYEKNSQNLNRYVAPGFLGSMGSTPMEAVSRGYVTMMPDVYYRTGQTHSDMLEAVEAATLKVIELGYADPAHIGLHGHSFGGEGAAFIATQSKLFAAVGMGAGVTDLTSDFVQSWGWSYQVSGGSGQNGSGYYINTQGRWGFSPWDKPDVYRFESALTHVREVRQPILIMHGTADPTVDFSEGMNFYNALRYNDKLAYMLAYPGEGHGLRGLANRRDLTIRYFQFFDHYLRGAAAPKWMTDGVPFLVKEYVKEPR